MLGRTCESSASTSSSMRFVVGSHWLFRRAPQHAMPKAPAPRYTLERPADALAVPTQREDSFRRGVSLSMYGGSVEKPSTSRATESFSMTSSTSGRRISKLVVRWFQVDTKAIEIAPSASPQSKTNCLPG